MNAETAVTFAVLAVTAYPVHMVADYVVGQTDWQAVSKEECWRALVSHVALYHLWLVGAGALVVVLFELPVSLFGAAAGVAVSVATHLLWDRRWPVRWLLEHTGSGPFSRLASHGMNGMHLADQSLHHACLWLAVLLAATL